MVNPNLCILCRGTRKLCGLTYCPVLVKYRVVSQVNKVKSSTEVSGSSPPSVYVGWVGYPKVVAGPSAPPGERSTEIYDLPERWLSLKLDDILSMRLTLISGLTRVEVKDVWSSSMMKLQEIALSERPIDIEMVLKKPPEVKVVLSDEAPPMGPRGPLRNLKVVGNASFGKPVEKVYYDTDLKATEAIVSLYKSGIPVSRIQKALSVGALGTGRRRKLVPTRWSITAVDDTVSRALVKEVKKLKELGTHLLYVMRKDQNLFVAILSPGPWSFEWMEAWFPGSTWNPRGREPVIEGDWEGPKGRTEYASIGGCYYAARLATAEYMLNVLKRVGTAVLYREIYEGFNIPIGVWFVRESLRELFRKPPLKFSSLDEVRQFLREITRVPVGVWWRRSHILTQMARRRTLDEFAGK